MTETHSAPVAPRVVFSCSGASDKAELTDRAARELHRRGLAKMVCMTGLAAGQSMQRGAASKAETIVVLDGCNKQCASKCVRAAGFEDFEVVVMNELGFIKGESPATPENITTVVDAALAAFAKRAAE